MTAPFSHVDQLGEESSVWFKLTPLLKAPDNPLTILMQMAERYGGVIPVNMASQRIILLTDAEHFKRVLVTKADDYIKYFDGLKPIFGKSMITHDGALWQKIRMPQQPAFKSTTVERAQTPAHTVVEPAPAPVVVYQSPPPVVYQALATSPQLTAKLSRTPSP